MDQILKLISGIIFGIFEWLKNNKDSFSSLNSLIATFAILVGAYWAWKKIIWQRPNECSLLLDINAKAIELFDKSALLTVETSLKNVGAAVFQISDSADARYRSWIKIHGVDPKDGLPTFRGGEVDWEKAHLLYDGWFGDSPELELEIGEEEKFAGSYLIPKKYSIVNIWVKVYEKQARTWRPVAGDQAKRQKFPHMEKRPFFWSANKTLSIDGIEMSARSATSSKSGRRP